MAAHGDILEITFNHPTVGSGVFVPKANEGNTFDPGGFRTNDDTSMVTVTGDLIRQINRVAGNIEVLVENDPAVRKDIQKAQQLAADPVMAVFTVTLYTGQVFKGLSVPVGDLTYDINAGTFPLRLRAGSFEEQ